MTHLFAGAGEQKFFGSFFQKRTKERTSFLKRRSKKPLCSEAGLRVAFYMPDLSGGGVERMRLALIAALRARGVAVTLVVGTRRGSLAAMVPADLPVVELGAGGTLQAIPRLARFIRREQPDVLVSSLDHNNIQAMVARVLSGCATQLVICQHNALSAELVQGWRYRVVPWAYWLLQGAAERVVAVSRGVASDLVDVSGISRNKICVIYNPVIDGGFAQRAACQAPHPWLLTKDAPVFVFVGRLVPQKDTATLLAAMEIVLRKRRARLILVGEGEEEAALRRSARHRGIAHAVAFVGFQANPLPWIKHADALVSASRYEGLGNAIVEALGCGTPVIATDCPHGPAEVLLDGAIGKLVPVGDAEALAAAILAHGSAVEDPARLQARALAFSADACAEAHLKLFAG